MKISVINDKETLEIIYKLRYEASEIRRDLHEHYQDKRFADTYDEAGIHFALYKDEALLGSARINISSNLEEITYGHLIENYIHNLQKPFAMISRLVVAPKARRKGYSNFLDEKRLNFLKKRNEGTAMVVTSCIFRIEKLIRLGFRLASEVEEINTFPGGKSTLLYLPLDLL